MIAVGVGKSLNQAELEGIANKPTSQYVFNVDSFDVLHTLQATLSTLTCAAGTEYIFILLYSSAGIPISNYLCYQCISPLTQ